MKIIDDYKKACEEVLKAFCEKHDYLYEEDSWLGLHVGHSAMIGDYVVGMDVMLEDLEKDIDEREFIKWYDYSINGGRFNYHTWLMGRKEIW